MTASRFGTVIGLLVGPLLVGSLGRAHSVCNLKPLRHQQRDAATIVRLEAAWNVAFLQGDTALERCLLMPDFTEIMRDGDVKYLSDELAFAARNIGHHLPPTPVPNLTVLVEGNVAVAYGIVVGISGTTRYADLYRWKNATWRVFFAQQTPVAAPGHPKT